MRTSTVVLVLIGLLSLAAGPRAAAQSETSTPSDSTALDRLIEQALESNLALQQEEVSLRQASKTLAVARGRFLPTVDLSARYSRADGGRTIDFPLGDLFNPVYSTLNGLLEQQGQPPQFSPVENQEINLLREEEQETKLTLQQPLFSPRVLYGYRARKHEVTAQRAGVEAFRRELVRDVQVAYFNYRKAQRRVGILRAAYEQVEENRRTSQSLFDADKVTRDVVLRARAEVLDVQQQIEEAQTQRDQAQSFLNFLLNRPLDTPIEASPSSVDRLVERRSREVLTLPPVPADTTAPLDVWQRLARQQRPELTRLSAAAEASEEQRRIAQSAFLPSVSLAVEAGIQGSDYGFGDQNRYYLGSVVLSWNLFNGFSDEAKVERARLETQRLRTQREEVSRQIELGVEQALDDVRVAQRSLQTARARVEAARESFRITSRRFEAERVNQVTFIDARTALTRAELNLNVTQYDLLTRLARLEFATALFPMAQGEFRMRND